MSEASFNHSSIIDNPSASNCSACHNAGGNIAPSFAAIHNGGYDPLIYTSTGVKYADAFKVTIDSAALSGNTLTIKFSAAESPDIAGLAVTGITPTVLVGLYGYDSKDFLIAAHGRSFDDNGDGAINSSDKRNLEYVVGETHPRFKTVSAANGSWEVTADLTAWKDQIAAGTIKRAEIVVLPALKDAAGATLGLNAPSRTFDLAKNAFDAAFFKPIAAAAKCNTCHDVLATTFHNNGAGGNVVACRICHVVSSGGSHLELQSRSIDSYAHAIHAFQAFDIGDIDFADPVQAMEYEHHINSLFPRFGVADCESCHVAGTFDIPDQANSMPGVLSATDTIKGKTRNIGAIDSTVTGPGARACGACHKAHAINEDDAGALGIQNQHYLTFGYSVKNETGTWEAVVEKIMSIFK